jgi:hypothetical protein
MENGGSRKPRFLTSEMKKARDGFFHRFLGSQAALLPRYPQHEPCAQRAAHTENSKLKTQNSKLKTQNSKLKTQNSKLKTPTIMMLTFHSKP